MFCEECHPEARKKRFMEGVCTEQMDTDAELSAL